MRTFFGCYLLVSLGTKNAWSKGRTYVGFTVNPRRRIRQHNGEVTNGASKTVRGRPWEMILVLYGFPTKISALQFEWAWQHPEESKIVREVFARVRKRNVAGAAGKVRLMFEMLHCSPWRYFPLKLQFFSSLRAKLKEGCRPPPLHVEESTAPMEDLPDVVDDNNDGDLDGRLEECQNESRMCVSGGATQKNGDIPEETTGHHKKKRVCAICQAPARPNWLICRCGVIHHIECLAEALLHENSQPPLSLPQRGHCPSCKEELKWIDLLQKVESCSTWSQKKQHGDASKQSNHSKKRDCKKTGRVCGKSQRTEGRAKKKQKFGNEHSSLELGNVAASGEDEAMQPTGVEGGSNEDFQNSLLYRITEDPSLLENLDTSCRSAAEEKGDGNRNVVMSNNSQVVQIESMSLLTPTPVHRDKQQKGPAGMEESSFVNLESPIENVEIGKRLNSSGNLQELVLLSDRTPQRMGSLAALPHHCPQSTSEEADIHVNLLTPEQPSCVTIAANEVLKPKDTNTIGDTHRFCEEETRDDKRMHYVPLRERLNQMLSKAQDSP